MRWVSGQRSTNIDDRRARTGMGRGTVGGGVGLLVAAVLSILFGKDFISGGGGSSGGASYGGAPGQPGQPEGELRTTPEEEKLKDHVAFALGGLEKTWREILGTRYQDSELVLYRAGTETGCGYGESAVGPFYCPADGKIYLDLSFFEEMERRLGAGGDFAQAYVLAHEFGHHVQNLQGTADEVRRNGRSNAQSVMMELQADCYAGVWGHHEAQRGNLEVGDLEEGLTAAAAIGDDTLQKQAGRRVQPESFTHGSSAQRVAWLKRGFERGRVEDCDTFTD
jgi:predicted metalloprotease